MLKFLGRKDIKIVYREAADIIVERLKNWEEAFLFKERTTIDPLIDFHSSIRLR
jgi:hypothetical protein